MEPLGGAAPDEGVTAAGATTAQAGAAPAGSGLPVFGHLPFSGTYDGKIEPSGRLILPAAFRHAFSVGGEVMVWAQPGEYIALYTRTGFQKSLEAKFAVMPEDMREMHPTLRTDIYAATPAVTIDSQFRFVVPPRVRDEVSLGDDVVFAGSIEFIRVMTRDAGEEAAQRARLLAFMNQTWDGLPTDPA